MAIEEGLGWKQRISVFLLFLLSLTNALLDLLDLFITILSSVLLYRKFLLFSEGAIPKLNLFEFLFLVLFNLVSVVALNLLIEFENSVSIDIIWVGNKVLDLVFFDLLLLHASDLKII